MRISELSRSSGVPVATIKYYLREGILPAGESRGATQAEYGDDHLRRLRLIRSLAELAGLPIAQIKVVLDVIEHPRDDLFTTLGRAIEALPPYLPRSAGGEHPLAEAAIERLGWTYDRDFAATAQLESALQAVADAGIPITVERLEVYGQALHSMAELDIAMMPAPGVGTDAPHEPRGGPSPANGSATAAAFSPSEASAAIEYAVLGTALYEPVVVALRRLAHQDVAARMLAADG